MLHLLFCFFVSTAFAGILEDLIIIGKKWDDYCKKNRQELVQAWTKPNDFFDPNRFEQNTQNSEGDERRYTKADIAGKIAPEIEDLLNEESRREKNKELGVKPIKGILLHGPPGTGKTLYARVLAGEMNAYFIPVSGSEFVEIWVGNGPKRVRELFEKAKQALLFGAPKVVIFIDEIDAIGGSRDLEPNSEYRNTLNELLKQMDGFAKNDKIMVIGATNHLENIDKALRRPGRFDRLVKINLPDYEDRCEICDHYKQKVKYGGSAELIQTIADKTSGFSQAELEGLWNEAAHLAARQDADWILDEHLEEAYEIALEQHRNR
jgi:ATP-dependent Zn protease